MVFRTDLSGDPSFRELLERVRAVALEAFRHQDLPFEKLVDELQPQRDLSREPLFQVMLVLQNVAFPPLQLPGGITLRAVETDTGTAKFDLTLMLWEDRQGLGGSVEYSTELFEADTITRWLQHFAQLLSGIVADPQRRISELPLLTAAEERQVLAAWIAAGAPTE